MSGFGALGVEGMVKGFVRSILDSRRAHGHGMCPREVEDDDDMEGCFLSILGLGQGRKAAAAFVVVAHFRSLAS